MARKIKYYLVAAEALPEIFIRVAEAKRMMQTGEADTVGAATKMAGISRSAFYKYKDAVQPFNDMKSEHIITFYTLLKDVSGTLSSVLGVFAASGANILTINQSIDFGSTAAAFTGDASADFTVEFEPSATALEKEGAGYVVASLGVDSGYVPYTSYSAKTSYMQKNPEVIQKFTNALQKGMEYVQTHTPEEIAKVIAPQFAETDLDTVKTIVKRYYDQDTWKSNLIFEKESFELLEDILEDASELNERVAYEDLVTTEYAEKAAEK